MPANRTLRYCYFILCLFTLSLIASFVVADGFAPAGRKLSKVTGIDPTGYFGVSHALLFHRNFNLTEEYTRVKPDENPWTAVRKETGMPGTIWAIGYSILATPFLATGTLVDAADGHPADGYSRFAILGYCMTNIVLTGVGMIALFTFLRDLAEFWAIPLPDSAIYALFATFATFFGTSVGYYSVSPMSHASTFFCVSMFLACWWRVRNRTGLGSWALLGLIAGFLSITRWQDIFFIGGPLLCDLIGAPLDFRKRLACRIGYLIAAGVCWIPQIAEWKFIFGKYAPPSPGDGFFVFPPLFVLQALFSTRNGWVAWTPLVLLGIAGLIWSAIRVPRLFLPWVVVLSLELALTGSMRTWHGGEGLGNRYMTSSTPLIALGVLTLVCLTRGYMRTAVIAGTVACSLFSVISAVQFRLDLVPRDDRLTLSEYLTDKLRLREVRRRKVAVKEAESLLERGSPADAARVLETAEFYGPDRDVLRDLSKAYREGGDPLKAQQVDQQLQLLVQNRLF
jgi:hypothetical protein